MTDIKKQPPAICGYAPGGYSTKCRKCKITMDFVDKRSHECINCAIDSANENMNISDDKIKNLTLMIEILQRENLNLKVKLNLTNNDKPEWKI